MITSPLYIQVSKKKKFYLNLNSYRNTHFFVLNKAKILYKESLAPQIASLSRYKRIKVTYTYYPKTKRRTDLGNVLSVHQKFFEDSFVEAGKIIDDDYHHITESIQKFGALDKNNPRVEIKITELGQ